MADQEKQSFLVQAEDGRKFKMVIRGDLNKIPVEKIKRYLKAYGVPDGQTLTHDGQVISDDMYGEDFGLTSNSVLQLSSREPPAVSRAHAELEANKQLGIDVEGRHRQQQYEELMRQQQQQAQANPYSSSMGVGSASSSMAAMDRPYRAVPDLPASPTPQATRTLPYGTPNQPPHRQPPAAAQSGQQSFQLWNAHNSTEEHPLHKQVVQLEQDNGRLRREVEALKLEIEAKRTIGPVESLLASAKANLQELGKELGLHLVLDQNLSCVIGNDDAHTIIVTFDAPTERLYVYSTLLSFIPEDPQLRLKLFEVLLDGALLGRDVAGGGIGASMQSGVVMMSTSLPLRHCGPGALREVVPAFVEALVRWRSVVGDVVGLAGGR